MGGDFVVWGRPRFFEGLDRRLDAIREVEEVSPNLKVGIGLQKEVAEGHKTSSIGVLSLRVLGITTAKSRHDQTLGLVSAFKL